MTTDIKKSSNQTGNSKSQNDARSSANYKAGEGRQSSSRGGFSEQHSKAGSQSHKNR